MVANSKGYGGRFTVIALGLGGALETVPTRDPVGGIFYAEATDEALTRAIELWDAREQEIQPAALQAYSARFSEAEFTGKMSAILFSPASAAAPR